MKMLRTVSTVTVAAFLALAVVGCSGNDKGGGGTAGRPSEPSGRLVVGTNAINADMVWGWTNLISNADAKALMDGYATVYYTNDDHFVVDPTVVKSFDTRDNADGGKTYTITINDNLTYNDGTKITAKDYAFTFLYYSSPFLRDIGATSLYTGNNVYQGFTEYNSGASDIFTGMRLLGEYEFSLTVVPLTPDGEETFPYWFEINYASLRPMPLHVIAPGCDVVDNGTGVQMTGPWSVRLLQSTMDNGSTGYRYTPYVTAGPYKFVSYDAGAYTLTLETNERYLGRGAEKVKPSIKNLIFFQVSDATALDALGTGTVDILIQQAGGDNISAGLDLVDSGRVNYVTYSRNGFGRITFHCDIGPTQFAEVRRAMAYCMDREEFVRQFTGGFAIIVNSRYGAAQWTYQDNREILERDLTMYSLNLDKAREELVSGGWTLNAQGGEYVTGIRHKRMPDGSLMPLVLDWFSPDSNKVGEMLATFVTANARSVGIELRQEWGDSTAFSNALYGNGTKRYNMINGGVGFSTEDTPWFYYQPDPSMFGPFNTNRIIDPVLDAPTQAMRNTTPGDNATYSRHWLAFVKRYNEVLPDIPLYSDNYHDFFNSKVKNYSRTALYPWYFAMMEAWVE